MTGNRSVISGYLVSTYRPRCLASGRQLPACCYAVPTGSTNHEGSMRLTLWLIIVAQWCCTSVWFAANAILPDLAGLTTGSAAHMTTAVQLGFIAGTLVFALLTIADRYPPGRVFLICAWLGATFNLGLLLPDLAWTGIMGLRFLTGLCLAGIYPVGMKIASDHFQQGLGRSLSLLVGALVLGTASPHLIRGWVTSDNWYYVVTVTSLLATAGGWLMWRFVPEGPYRQRGNTFHWKAAFEGFRIPAFRSAAGGYFGHMWELYTFWAFVPLLLGVLRQREALPLWGVSGWSFVIIAAGAIGCAVIGRVSHIRGEKRTGLLTLTASGCCCLLAPLFVLYGQPPLAIALLIVWGFLVIPDGPLFLTLVARHAPAAWRGTSLTIVNCIGFSITILSMQFLQWISAWIPFAWLPMLLAIGPMTGVWMGIRSRHLSPA